MHVVLRAARGASSRLAAVATPRAPIPAGLRFAQPSLPPPPRLLSTQPRSQRGERGLLFAELKRCRRGEDVARLETRLLPLRTTKEWTKLISAHARVGDRRRAFGLLDEMRQAGCEPDVFSYSILINLCARSKDWKTAVSLLREMPGAGVQPDVVSYNATISACEKAGRWEKAVSLLREMPAAGVQPNVVSYNATISACEKAGHWEKALSLMREMPAAGVQPDVISYNATISACEKASE